MVSLFKLPEWRTGLEPINQKRTSVESRFAVRRGCYHQYDTFAWRQSSVGVNDQDGLKCPPPLGFGHDPPEFLFGHAWVVLKRHCDQLIRADYIPYQPNEADYATDAMVMRNQPFNFDATSAFYNEMELLRTGRLGLSQNRRPQPGRR